MALALLFVTAVAFAVAVASTPLAKRLAHALDVFDRPSDRSVDRRAAIPLLGGLADALALFVVLPIAIDALALPRSKSQPAAYTRGGMLLLAVGVIDDRFSLSALPKLAVQIAVAAIAIHFGFRIDHLTDPVTREAWMFPTWLTWAVTAVWIVGVT